MALLQYGKSGLATVAVFIVALMVASACSGGPPSATATSSGPDCTDALYYGQCVKLGTTTPGFDPQTVLSSFLLKPGAKLRTPQLSSGEGKLSVRMDNSICTQSLSCPGIETAVSHQYVIGETQEELQGWYQRWLGRMGYQVSEQSTGGGGDAGTWRANSYFQPNIPNADVELHTYSPAGEATSTVFDLLIAYVPSAERSIGEYLPPDVTQVTVSGGDYAPGTPRVVTDSASVKALVRAVNSMPVQEGKEGACVTTGPLPGSTQTPPATLTFAGSGNPRTLSYVDGCPSLVQFQPYSNYLHDAHGVLRAAIQDALRAASPTAQPTAAKTPTIPAAIAP